eukprot:Rhum_TRINITY_DN10744_c0_g2::Rhum_TRINITY_DN10744_c0_g2_i1::g.39863::m.39863
MAESAGLGFLNLCLKLSGGSDEVSEIEYKRLVKELKPGTASEDAAVAILKSLGARGDAVLRRTGAGGAGGGASGSPRSSVGPSSTAGSPASPGKLKATWGTASPESTPASPPKAAASPAGSPGKLKATWGNNAASPASPGKLKATWGNNAASP